MPSSTKRQILNSKTDFKMQVRGKTRKRKKKGIVALELVQDLKNELEERRIEKNFLL